MLINSSLRFDLTLNLWEIQKVNKLNDWKLSHTRCGSMDIWISYLGIYVNHFKSPLPRWDKEDIATFLHLVLRCHLVNKMKSKPSYWSWTINNIIDLVRELCTVSACSQYWWRHKKHFLDHITSSLEGQLFSMWQRLFWMSSTFILFQLRSLTYVLMFSLLKLVDIFLVS